MADKKQAKFFCENCGAEVSQSARFCKKCGRFFSSVRCPVCGRTGSSHSFAKGCPSCGYAGKGRGGFSSAPAAEGARDAAAGQKDHFFLHRRRGRHSGARVRPNAPADGALPLWVYAVTICALLALVAGLVECVVLN